MKNLTDSVDNIEFLRLINNQISSINNVEIKKSKTEKR